MTREKSERTLRRRLAEATARNTIVENALRGVWLWNASDATDLELLRQILVTADRDIQISSALDNLMKES